MAAVDYMSRGHMLADSVAIIGSLDIVLVKLTDEYFNPYC